MTWRFDAYVHRVCSTDLEQSQPTRKTDGHDLCTDECTKFHPFFAPWVSVARLPALANLLKLAVRIFLHLSAICL
jgi:hypothetical protein